MKTVQWFDHGGSSDVLVGNVISVIAGGIGSLSLLKAFDIGDDLSLPYVNSPRLLSVLPRDGTADTADAETASSSRKRCDVMLMI